MSDRPIPPYREPRVILRTGKSIRPAPPTQELVDSTGVRSFKEQVDESRRRQNAFQRDQIARQRRVPCPTCGAGIDEPCRLTRDLKKYMPFRVHQARWRRK